MMNRPIGFSVRHHLGAVLLDAGHYKTAVKVYEEDLKNFPKTDGL